MRLELVIPRLLRRRVCNTIVAVVAVVSCAALPENVAAKIPGAIHCFNDICHRVRTVEETAARRGIVEPVTASFYDAPDKDRFNPSFETSSGSLFDPDADDNAVSPIHPDGTVLLLWSPVTHGAAIVRVNNAGPYFPGRTLDVSHGVAERLGFANGGVMQLLSVVVAAPSEPEAHYVRGRVYPKVHGYIGKFENIALASFAAPVARAALYEGSAPLPRQALGSSEEILLNAAEERFRLSALAREFATVPADLIAPPDSMTDDAMSARVTAALDPDLPAELDLSPRLSQPIHRINNVALILPPEDHNRSQDYDGPTDPR